MFVVILTPVRLLGEGIASSLHCGGRDTQTVILRDLASLADLAAADPRPDAVIVDVTQAADLENIRDFHGEFPDLPLLALGLREREAEIVAHGRAGFAGYISRDDGSEELCQRVEDAVRGRFACTPEMAAGLMRGLFRLTEPEPGGFDIANLTPREEHVARLVARGLSNKEIARQLMLSESTVKHHVHSILNKSGMSRRVEVMRSIRAIPWGRPVPAVG